MYTLIDGKRIASEIKDEIAAKVAEKSGKGIKVPHLAAILVGNDGSSETYVANKVRDCKEVGFKSTLIRLAEETTTDELLNHIRLLNEDSEVDGFIVQLPLPRHIDEARIIEAIDPAKDVDGFHPVNIGKMVTGLRGYLPATPFGIAELIMRYNIETEGKSCVIIGRSNIVGRPQYTFIPKGMDATVTVVHSKTKNINDIIQKAEIVVAAIGSPHFVKADMIQQGAVVIDVGTTRIPSKDTKSGWKLVGDVDFEQVAPKCSFITPVPGVLAP